MVEELALEQQDVTKCCLVLEASRSGYYTWLNSSKSAQKIANEILLLKVKQIWEQSRGTYGLPRICEKLKTDGIVVGKNRVQKIMKQNNIQGVGKKKFKVMTTDSNHDLPIADRIFRAEEHSAQVDLPPFSWTQKIQLTSANFSYSFGLI